MTGAWLGVVVAVPALLAAGALVPAWRRPLVCALPFAPLPALFAAVVVPDDTVLALPWLLLGGTWSLDAVRRLLLAQMALVWTLGALVAPRHTVTAPRLPPLALPWLVALTGTLWVTLAQDIAGFYSGFALLSFGAYPLVVARDGADAAGAGRRYLAYTIGAEMALLVGLVGASARGAGQSLAGVAPALATSPESVGVLLLLALLVGFGVKSALLGVHGWLPTTYTVAPAPVRVVLGGALINAGVLGWLVTLPLGTAANPEVGRALVVLGLLAAIGGALRGTLLNRVPTMLGWSSVSQMGLVTLLLGVGLATDRPETAVVVALYAAHHGLAKGALFAGSARHWPLPVRARWLLLVPMLALAGAPLTSGAVAKLGLKQLLGEVGWSALVPWTSVAAIGTTLLLTRVLWQVIADGRAAESTTRDAWDWRWPLITLAAVSAVWWWPITTVRDPGVHSVPALLCPIVAGVLASAGLARWRPVVAAAPEPPHGERGREAMAPGADATAPRAKTAEGSPTPVTAAAPAAAPDERAAARADHAERRLRRALPWLLGLLWLGGWLALSAY